VVAKTVLDNGVRVVTERLPQAFSVTVGLWMEVGSRDEGPPLSGASHFIEHMAFKGTGRRGALDIAREIDRLGGHANAFTGKESTCYHARALSPRLGELTDLLTDLLLHPAYAPEELERERQVILQEIASQEDTPEELVHVLFGRNLWPGHPLGRPVLGTAETIAGLGRGDILDYQRSNYLPQDLVMSAVGNLEHERVVELVSQALGSLPAGDKNGRRVEPAPAPGLHIMRRSLEQVHLVLGHPAPAATDQRRFAAALLNLILGGTMSSRLFQEVRERRGLAYAVYSFLSTYSDSGVLGVYLGVAPGRAAEALAVVKAEIERLAAHPVEEEELAGARESLTGSILLAAENPESRMSRLAKNELNFGREVPLEEVADRVQAVTSGEISALAAELLAPGGLAVTVLGPADEDALHREMYR
jgi:predicted Zn-dependent peptidase